MKIVVTGCAGYIGSELCAKLTENPSYHVIGVDNLLYGNIYSLQNLLKKDNFEFHLKDIRSIDKHFLLNIYCKADIIIPLAAIVGAPACDKFAVEATAVNTISIHRLMKCVSNDQKIIFPNTNSGYGQNDDICTEETEFNPVSHYAQTKCDAEDLILDHPNSVSLRLATVFGVSNRMRFDLMFNDFVKQAIFDGYISVFEPHFKRNFIHIKDIVRAFTYALNPSLQGIYNVGNDKLNCTKQDVVEFINIHIPFKWSFKQAQDPDQRNYTVSSQKLYSTGFECKYNFLDGLNDIQKFCQYTKEKHLNRMNNLRELLQ